MVILLVAGLLAGCKRDEVTLRQEIAVTSGVSGLQKRVHSIDNNTALQAQDIKIDAYYDETDTKMLDGVKLHYTGGDPAWVFWDGSAQVHYYWPFEGSKTSTGATASTLDFVGFCPFEEPDYITGFDYDATDGASFDCDMSDYMTKTSQEGLDEFLISVLPDQTLQTQTDAGGALPMVFKHPFALVKFVIAAASGTHVTVDSIAIAGLYTGGTCTYNGTTMTWVGTGSGSMEIKGLSLKVGTGSTETAQMMVIPYNYVAKSLYVRGTWDDWSDVEEHTIDAELDFNWQPGYSYTYNLTVSKYALKVDISEFTEQW